MPLFPTKRFVTRAASLGLLVVGFAGRFAAAQSPGMYRKSTPEQVAQRTFQNLFSNIALDSARATEALARVRQCLTDQYAVSAFDTDFRQKVARLADARNADLRMLLRTATDSAQFNDNEKKVDASLPVKGSGKG